MGGRENEACSHLSTLVRILRMTYSEVMSKEEILTRAIEVLHTRTFSVPWDEISEIINRIAAAAKLDYWLPVAACQSLNGSALNAVPASAAILASQASITLVDDILDDDPKGIHIHVGPGATANIAMALQTLAYDALGSAEVPIAFRVQAIMALNEMLLKTTYGQAQDLREISSEQDYWNLVGYKSMPFYGFALQVGGIMAQGSESQTHDLYELGRIVGAIVQLLDDLYDAFEKPAKPDWDRKTNNILILYALNVDHDHKQEFLDSLDDKASLERLQRILVESGAVSYCAYQITLHNDRCRQLAENSGFPNLAPIQDLLADQIRPLEAILNAAGAELPSELTRLG